MTTAAKWFNAVSLVLSTFMVLTVLIFIFMIIPSVEDGKNMLWFLVAVYSIVFVALAGPAVANLSRNRLAFLPAIVQVSAYVLGIYTIPLAVWGIVLLVKDQKGETVANKELERTP